uniref:Doublecortin domain-containing protein n=1 Tax=Myripristis murdjan TaxID=586833 RepID=A0A667X151_9TELE
NSETTSIASLWDPQPLNKHGLPLPSAPPSTSRHTHLTTTTPAKRITFYKSGDSQFGGVRMAIHKRSFKCFDALLDDLSQKVPLPFGVRTVTTPRGTHNIKHLEQLQDGGCYLCSDRRQAKPINMELASKRLAIWHHHGRRPQRPEAPSSAPPSHTPYRQRRILLVKNSDPGLRRSVVLSRRVTRSLRAFLDEISELMQFHVRKLYTVEGRRLSTRFRSVFMGIFDHSSRSAFVRSNTDVGQEGLARSLRSNSSQRCSLGLRSGLCAGQSSSSTPNSLIHVFMDLALCTGAQSCWNRKGHLQTVPTKLGA